MNPYSTLEVSESATQEEIKNAYRKLAKKFHPDLNPGNKEAETRFKEINAAYEMIGTKEAREKFDRGDFDETSGPSAGSQGGKWRYEQRGPFYYKTQGPGGRYTHSFSGDMDEDLFSDLFGRFNQGGASSRARPNLNEYYKMDIDFKDAVLGAKKEIVLPSGKKIQVKIPPGIDSGKKLRFAGLGKEAQGKKGDVFVEITVGPSQLFKRVGQDLEVEVPITLYEAVLGGEIKVPTVGGSILLKIPPGSDSKTRLRARGKGVGASGKKAAGDLIVSFRVEVPKDVPDELKEAVIGWKDKHPYDPRKELFSEAQL